jgi:two-component system, cell cycle response regulator
VIGDYEGVLGKLPHPSLEDVLMLVGYGLVIAALLRFPTTRAGAVQAAETNSSESREEQALLGAVEALAAVVDARDDYIVPHSASVAALSRQIAVMLGCDANQTNLIGHAARLHDIGKVTVPDAILGKQGPLSRDEWQLIRQHPAIGADIAGRIPRLRAVTPLIRAHHERYDGTGYPDRLAGGAIPLGARIISAADAYDAMVTDRPYGGVARSPAEALQELARCAGTQFDPRVVTAFMQLLAHDQAAIQAA